MDVSCLYVSADMDATDALTREGGMRTGFKVDEVAEMIKGPGADYVYSELERSKIS